MGLLDVADVVRQDGEWSHGYDQQGSSCGLAARILDICDQAVAVTVRGDLTKAPEVLKIEPFAIDAMVVRDNRCALPDDEKRVADTLAMAEEKAIAQMFQDGAGVGWASPSLSHENVTVLTPPANQAIKDILAAELSWFYAVSTNAPIVHLGIGAAFSLNNEAADLLERLGIPVAVSPGYTSGLVAVTGPVAVNIGREQTVEVYNTGLNKTEVQNSKIVTIDFDTCGSVVYSPAPVGGFTFSRSDDFEVTTR